MTFEKVTRSMSKALTAEKQRIPNTSTIPDLRM